MKQISHDAQIERYQALLYVETENLDDECREHAITHSDIALNAARATSRAAGLKLDLKESIGEWGTQIRDRLNSDKKGDGPKGRVTDKQVESELSSQPQLMLRYREIGKVEAEARDWEALRESSKERGFQMRNLVDMMIADVVTPRAAKPSRRTSKQLQHGNDQTGRARL